MPNQIINIEFSDQVKLLGISLTINPIIGWGNYALNLALQLPRISNFSPVVLFAPHRQELLNPLHREIISQLVTQQQQIQKIMSENQANQISLNIPILHALNAQLVRKYSNLIGSQNIALDFSVDTNISPEALLRARHYDLIIAGSSWNAQMLQSYDIKNVQTVLQGIDPSKFHLAPKANLFKDRFVIFSGGKLEYRKGQDIVVEVFKRFVARHREALLITSWYNAWPSTMMGIQEKGYVQGIPQLTSEKKLLVKQWLIANGINDENCIDLGIVANDLLPPIMREADVAIFPNRAEGGTNLVAMECLACGVPTILSANTGHLDLIKDEHSYSLNSQTPANPDSFEIGSDGWGESDIEEVLETLEHIYNHPDQAKNKGHKAATFMQDWTWEKQITRLSNFV